MGEIACLEHVLIHLDRKRLTPSPARTTQGTHPRAQSGANVNQKMRSEHTESALSCSWNCPVCGGSADLVSRAHVRGDPHANLDR